jgi:hypothetical protein
MTPEQLKELKQKALAAARVELAAAENLVREVAESKVLFLDAPVLCQKLRSLHALRVSLFEAWIEAEHVDEEIMACLQHLGDGVTQVSAKLAPYMGAPR